MITFRVVVLRLHVAHFHSNSFSWTEMQVPSMTCFIIYNLKRLIVVTSLMNCNKNVPLLSSSWQASDVKYTLTCEITECEMSITSSAISFNSPLGVISDV